MNITKYKGLQDELKIFYGKASIIDKFIVANADEYCYQFLGKNSCYAFTQLIHKDDVMSFLEAVGKLHEGTQSVIARVKCYSGNYRCLCLTLTLNGRIMNGFQSFDIDFSDVISIQESYLKYSRTITKYRKFFSLISVLYLEYKFKTNVLTIYRYQNSKSVTFFNKDLDELKEEIKSAEDLSEDTKKQFDVFYENLVKGNEYYRADIPAEIFDRSKEGFILKLKTSLIYRDDTKDMVVGIMKPSDEAEKEIYYLSDAARDVGTGLLNKRAISEYAIEKISNSNKDLYMIMLDIDDFKEINDTYGHMYGDEVLRKVSDIVLSVFSVRGTVGRFGGDEFLILVENVKDENDLRLILKTINKHIQWTFCDSVNNINVTTSMGIVKCPKDGTTYEELFNKADKCLYIAKQKGKNRYIIYDEAKHSAWDNIINSKAIGINYLQNNRKKGSVVSDIILNLYSKGIDVILESINVMQVYFDLDGIAIYLGDNLKRIYTVGNYNDDFIEFKLFNNEKYKELFNDNNVFAENNIHKLETEYEDIYKEYLKQDIAEFVQCVTYVDSKPQALISYDIFRRPRKWSETDIDYLTIIGKLICDIVIRNILN